MKHIILVFTIASFFACNTIKTTSSSKEPLIDENFEGIVKYKFLMDDVRGLSNDEIEKKIEQVEPMFGRHMVYYLKEPKMKSVMDGQMMKLTSFNDNTDSMIIHSPDLGELNKVSTYDNWNFKYDTIIRKKDAITISGASCDLIRFQSDNHTWSYYYNDNLKVNPENFKHYQSCFWNKAIDLCGSLPMRFEGKIPGTYIYLEAEEIIRKPLLDSEFEIPNN